MTTRTSRSGLFPVSFRSLANLLAAWAMVAVTNSASLAQAEPAGPPTTTTTAEHPTKPEKKGKGAPARVTAGKTKATSRSVKPAKPAKGSATPAAAAESTDKPATAAKPSQVMDFDTDDVAGTRLEPGFELIEGAPAKARHGSLVEPLKPGDSVVHRE